MSRRQVEVGAVIRVGQRVFTVTHAEPATSPPPDWPEHDRGEAARVTMRAHDDQAVYAATLPRTTTAGGPFDVEVLAPADEEGHHPICGHCHGPWPCVEVERIRYAGRRADELLATIEHEATFTWTCSWCTRFSTSRPRRFKTERGRAQHERRCRFNAHTWDVSRWVHRFDDQLRITGGFDPAGYQHMRDTLEDLDGLVGNSQVPGFDQLVTIHRAVQRAVTTGQLPGTLEQLEL